MFLVFAQWLLADFGIHGSLDKRKSCLSKASYFSPNVPIWLDKKAKVIEIITPHKI